MKNYFILLSILFANVLFAQNKYETFVVNDSVGIVEVTTLNEIYKPSFDFSKRLEININYFTYIESDSLKIFNKQNGNWEKMIPIKNYSSLYLTPNFYFHTILDNKSVILDSIFQKHFTLKKTFSNFDKLNNEFILGKEKDSYSIFKISNNKCTLKYSLYATNYTKKNRNENNGGNEEMLVFFGGNKTYVFNNKLELVKTHNKKITDEYEIYDIINPIQTKIGIMDETGSNYRNLKLIPEKFFKINSDTDEVNQYTSEISDLVVVTNNNYDLNSYDSKNFIAFKIFHSLTKTGNKMTSMSSKNGFRFIIDSKTAKALIPLKYQLEMGLEILKKQ